MFFDMCTIYTIKLVGNMSNKPKYLSYGLSVTEYFFCSLVIIGVSLSGLFFLGDKLSALVTHMLSKSERSSSPIIDKTSALSPYTQLQLSEMKSREQNSDIAKDLRLAIITSGANGVTKLLAKQLEVLASQLLSAGKITPEQAGLFQVLANQGHRIARIEQLLESACPNCTTKEQYAQQTVSFEGQTYHLSELAATIGWANSGFQNSFSPQTPDLSKELSSFATALNDLQRSGALQDPDVQKQTDTLVTEIANLSESVEDNVTRLSVGLSSTPLNKSLASDISNYDSMGICQSGKATDNGKHCAQ